MGLTENLWLSLFFPESEAGAKCREAGSQWTILGHLLQGLWFGSLG